MHDQYSIGWKEQALLRFAEQLNTAMCMYDLDISTWETRAMNNRIYPPPFGPLSPKESLEKELPSEHFPLRERTHLRWWIGFCLLLLFLCIGIGSLYSLHPDLAIGTAILVAYAGLYWAYRKTRGTQQKPGYPVIRYRGHPGRKKGFFS